MLRIGCCGICRSNDDANVYLVNDVQDPLQVSAAVSLDIVRIISARSHNIETHYNNSTAFFIQLAHTNTPSQHVH